MDLNIRERTEHTDLAKEQGDALYEDLWQAERDKRQVEHQVEFGGNPKFPFRPDTKSIHMTVLRQMAAMREEE